MLASGAAGTGKSLAALWKLHIACSSRPNVRCLIVRKTRVSLTESALVTYERHVLGDGQLPGGAGRANRHAYQYPQTKSEIIIGGMDNPTRVMSTEYDLIYVQEAIELAEAEWEALTTRLRNHALPYQQLLADTNPDRPTHWLKKRCDAGTTRMLHSRHEDNPALWNAAKGQWTPNGVDYIAKLDRLTGPRKQRLRYGRWVQAEGVIYEEWEPTVHVQDAATLFPGPFRKGLPPYDWPRYLAIDFGFNDPFVAQWWAVDEDHRCYLYREIVRTGKLVEDMAKEIAAFVAADGVKPRAIICDHDAEARATLDRHLGGGLRTRPAQKAILPGIEVVSSRLRVQGDGKPRLFVCRQALANRDATMDEAKSPIGLVEEMDSWAWEDGKHKDVPVDRDNHSQDACRYFVHTILDPMRPKMAFRVV